MQRKKLFLVGPMGAGKSTIGRLLASELGLSFKDSDQEIEARTGADIPWIFDVEGESGFRDREEAMIDELTQLSEVVLATGGGAVLREVNRQNLRSRGTVVYLETTVAQQLKRTANDRNRPLLQSEDPRQVLTDLMKERAPLYEDVADLVVSTQQGNPKEVVKHIKAFLDQSV